MKSKIILTFLFFILSGCVGVMENPYKNIAPADLKNISSDRLCDVAKNIMIQRNKNVSKELRSRGFEDCSDGERYCFNLGLKKGTKTYTACRLEHRKYEVAKEIAQSQTPTFVDKINESNDRQMESLNNSIMSRQRQPINCNSYRVGYQVHTNCY